jgi:hypothetical protein
LTVDIIHSGENVKWIFREVTGVSDISVVLGPWIKQIRTFEPFNGFNRDEFEEHIETFIKPTIAMVGITFAANPLESTHTYGWVCAERSECHQIVHFCYVRHLFRNQGIATSLLKSTLPGFKVDPIYYTYPARCWKWYRDKWKAKFNPYLIGA